MDRLISTHAATGPPRFQTCPYLLTIHDIKSVGLSEVGQQIEQAALSPEEMRVIQEAAGLITISESTHSDIDDRIWHDGPGCHTCHSFMALMPLLHRPGTSRGHTSKYGWERYIFFVGTLQYRKNLPRLIEALPSSSAFTGIPHKLVLAGRDGWGAELVYASGQGTGHGVGGGLSGLHPGKRPAQASMPPRMSSPIPRLHEGFGIPLLEAMASGTVVYTSNLFSIPEVAGDAAVYVDPYNRTIWRRVCGARCTMTRSGQPRRQGKARAASFSWQRMAAETLVYC